MKTKKINWKSIVSTLLCLTMMFTLMPLYAHELIPQNEEELNKEYSFIYSNPNLLLTSGDQKIIQGMKESYYKDENLRLISKVSSYPPPQIKNVSPFLTLKEINGRKTEYENNNLKTLKEERINNYFNYFFKGNKFVLNNPEFSKFTIDVFSRDQSKNTKDYNLSYGEKVQTCSLVEKSLLLNREVIKTCLKEWLQSEISMRDQSLQEMLNKEFRFIPWMWNNDAYKSIIAQERELFLKENPNYPLINQIPTSVHFYPQSACLNEKNTALSNSRERLESVLSKDQYEKYMSKQKAIKPNTSIRSVASLHAPTLTTQYGSNAFDFYKQNPNENPSQIYQCVGMKLSSWILAENDQKQAIASMDYPGTTPKQVHMWDLVGKPTNNGKLDKEKEKKQNDEDSSNLKQPVWSYEPLVRDAVQKLIQGKCLGVKFNPCYQYTFSADDYNQLINPEGPYWTFIMKEYKNYLDVKNQYNKSTHLSVIFEQLITQKIMVEGNEVTEFSFANIVNIFNEYFIVSGGSIEALKKSEWNLQTMNDDYLRIFRNAPIFPVGKKKNAEGYYVFFVSHFSELVVGHVPDRLYHTISNLPELSKPSGYQYEVVDQLKQTVASIRYTFISNLTDLTIDSAVNKSQQTMLSYGVFATFIIGAAILTSGLAAGAAGALSATLGYHVSAATAANVLGWTAGVGLTSYYMKDALDWKDIVIDVGTLPLFAGKACPIGWGLRGTKKVIVVLKDDMITFLDSSGVNIKSLDQFKQLTKNQWEELRKINETSFSEEKMEILMNQLRKMNEINDQMYSKYMELIRKIKKQRLDSNQVPNQSFLSQSTKGTSVKIIPSINRNTTKSLMIKPENIRSIPSIPSSGIKIQAVKVTGLKPDLIQGSKTNEVKIIKR